MASVFRSDSEEATRRFGEQLGRRLRGGEVVLLQGDLGVGKTQLTKGLACGLGVEAEVVSPTFTLVATYEGRLPLAHYDLYRIEEARDLQEIGYLEEDDPRAVRVVEWGERAEPPAHAIVVRMSMGPDGARRIEVEGMPEADGGHR